MSIGGPPPGTTCPWCGHIVSTDPPDPRGLRCVVCKRGPADAAELARWRRLRSSRRQSIAETLEEVLEPGETIRCEGRAEGVPPSPILWMVILLGVLPFLAVGAFTLGQMLADPIGALSDPASAVRAGAPRGPPAMTFVMIFARFAIFLPIGVYAFVRWRSQAWALTTRRILIVRGVLWRSVETHRLRRGIRIVERRREVLLEAPGMNATIPRPPPQTLATLSAEIESLIRSA